MNKRQRAIGSKGVALEAARREIIGATEAELPDILRQYGAQCLDHNSALHQKQSEIIYFAMERVIGTPVPFDAKIAKWLRSALSKDNERPYLQWAHIERQSNGTTYVFATDGSALHGVIVQDDTFPSGHAVRIDKAGNVFTFDRAAEWVQFAVLVYEAAPKRKTKKEAAERLNAPKAYSFGSLLPTGGLCPATLSSEATLPTDDGSGIEYLTFIIQREPTNEAMPVNVKLHKKVTALDADWKTWATKPNRPLLYSGQHFCKNSGYGLALIALVMPLMIPKK